jgi:hypothetical protein
VIDRSATVGAIDRLLSRNLHHSLSGRSSLYLIVMISFLRTKRDFVSGVNAQNLRAVVF